MPEFTGLEVIRQGETVRLNCPRLDSEAGPGAARGRMPLGVVGRRQRLLCPGRREFGAV